MHILHRNRTSEWNLSNSLRPASPGPFYTQPTKQQPRKPADQHTNQKSRKIASQSNEKSSKISFQRPSWRGSWGHVGLKNRSWRGMLGSKIGLGGPLGGSWGHLGPKSNLRPQKVRRWASKGLPGTPNLEAKLDQDGTKLGPSGP